MTDYTIKAEGTLTDIGAEILRQLDIDDVAKLGKVLIELADIFSAETLSS